MTHIIAPIGTNKRIEQMDIKVGQRYIVRNKSIVLITDIVLPDNPFYNKGFRFKGHTVVDTDVSFYTTYTMLFRETGEQFSDDVKQISSPYDIIELYIEPPLPVKNNEVHLGDIAGVIEHDAIVKGRFANWTIARRYDFDEALYSRVTAKYTSFTRNSIDKAYVVAVSATGSSGDVVSVIVAVAIDCQENGILYQLLTLTMGDI